MPVCLLVHKPCLESNVHSIERWTVLDAACAIVPTASKRTSTTDLRIGLTKLRSATAGEGAHGGGRKGWSHGKLVRTPASGWLHRLVRLFVIHAFNRRDCHLDGDWIKCELDVVDLWGNSKSNIIDRCL